MAIVLFILSRHRLFKTDRLYEFASGSQIRITTNEFLLKALSISCSDREINVSLKSPLPKLRNILSIFISASKILVSVMYCLAKNV